MGSPSELSLDYGPVNGCLATLKPFGDQPDQTQKLEEFLARLEEERLKIEAFKRELPLCMQLLNNAMEFYGQQLEMYHSTNQGPCTPVLEEFIPVKQQASPTTGGAEKPPVANSASSEKAGWMTSALLQLWSPADGGGGAMQPAAPPEDADPSFNVSPKVVLDSRHRHCGAFHPFSKERSGSGRASGVIPDLALAPMEEKDEKKLPDVDVARRESCGKGAHEQGKAAASASPDGGGQAAATAQTHRKARRCWTPELHRRFVNALQMLGGSQVATPKQIRELMKVDGLTNDEVKSHLQKYRLHTRRPIPAPSAAASAAAPQLLLLGGIWVPPEYATTAAAGPVIYGGNPAAAAHFCPATPLQQDHFYSPPLQPTPYHPKPQHRHEHGMAVAAASGLAYQLVKNESPESEVRGRQLERSESIEDGEEKVEEDDEVEEEEEEEGRQSESSSWKEGDDKALGAAVEDMNLSDCTSMGLKF